MLDGIVIQANKVPIYLQLREQILRMIGAGVLVPGDQLPTVRETSARLRVNSNTVQQAYAELERAGAIVVQRGRGTFVAAEPKAIDPALRETGLDGFASEVIAGGKALGVGSEDLFPRIRRIDPDF